jgi:hypothetical protein
VIRRAAALVAAVIPVFAACSTSQPLPCPVVAGGSCPSLDGVRTFCTWTAWGCAPEAACDGYFAVVEQGTSARLTYYYSAATGAFVATVQEAFGGGSATCLVGPAEFKPPSGCDLDTLADCAPLEGDAGVVLIDAATDGPFSAPAPSSSPSSQPFTMPPNGLGPYPPR